jgi:two-component system sensor histidine kinase/response regulator
VRKIKIIILFTGAMLILILAGVKIYSFTSNILSENEEIAQLTNLYEKLESVRLGIRSAIINQRDYTLTGDSTYLIDYNNSKQSTIEQFNAFSQKGISDYIPESTLDSLSYLLTRNFSHLDELIQLGKVTGFEDMEGYIDNYSTDIFNKFSSINMNIETRIEQKFNDFRLNTVSNAKKSELFIIPFYSVSVLFLLISFIVLYRQNLIRLRLVNELKENNNIKNKFFSIIAHDLRSPFMFLINLSSIIDSDEMLQNETLLKEVVKNVETTSVKTYNLLNNLLEWANSQTGQLKLHREELMVNSLVLEILGLYSQSIENKKISLSYKESPCTINADKSMISTVLRNLIGNAIKFVPEQGHISIKIKETENGTEILIRDDGPGLTRDDIKKLFRPDVNTVEIGNPENKGSGLGLILCKEFIDKHSGKIFARPNQDKGCTFGFVIPKN